MLAFIHEGQLAIAATCTRMHRMSRPLPSKGAWITHHARCGCWGCSNVLRRT